MNDENAAAGLNVVDFDRVVSAWREYASIRLFSDYDEFLDDEISIPGFSTTD